LFNLFKRKKKSGCPNCYEKDIFAFGADYLENKFISSIKLTDEIGGIKIYECEKCNTKFYIKGNMYERIIDGQIELLQKWSEKNLICPDDLKNEIEKIGLTNDWNLNRIAPCKIELNNGKKFEYTTLKFSNEPPLGFHYTTFKNIFFIDEVKYIAESDYGVSFEIRNQAEKSEEKRMGFYPTVLKTKEGNKIALNGISLFFNSYEIKGSELELANEEWNHKEKYIYDTEDKSEKTIVIAKK
jgi:hypothetical protein